MFAYGLLKNEPGFYAFSPFAATGVIVMMAFKCMYDKKQINSLKPFNRSVGLYTVERIKAIDALMHIINEEGEDFDIMEPFSKQLLKHSLILIPSTSSTYQSLAEKRKDVSNVEVIVDGDSEYTDTDTDTDSDSNTDAKEITKFNEENMSHDVKIRYVMEIWSYVNKIDKRITFESPMYKFIKNVLRDIELHSVNYDKLDMLGKYYFDKRKKKKCLVNMDV